MAKTYHMYKVLVCCCLMFCFSCQQDPDNSKKTVSTIDLGVFTGQNYNSPLIKLNIPNNWKYELQGISLARQQQLSKEQVKENILPLSEVKEVTLFEAKENITDPEAIKANPIPGSIVCLIVNANKQETPDLNKYIENFRAEMASRNTQTAIAQFHLSGTRDQKFNNINFKVIDSEIKYPTIEGAENIVIKSKMMFHKKGDLIYRYSLSYSKTEQLQEILQIIASIVYK